MSSHGLITSLAALVLLAAVTSPVSAAPSLHKQGAAPSSLAPAQIDAVRVIGRSVLAAKHRALDDPADAELLKALRADVDRQLAAETAHPQSAPITLQGQKIPAAGKALGSSLTPPRRPDRAAARALIERLERRAAAMEARGRADTGIGPTAVGPQRARLYRRWAEQLDAALGAADAGERVARLRALQVRLAGSPRGLVDAPRIPGTPTLQAMPAGGGAPSTPKKPARP